MQLIGRAVAAEICSGRSSNGGKCVQFVQSVQSVDDTYGRRHQSRTSTLLWKPARWDDGIDVVPAVNCD